MTTYHLSPEAIAKNRRIDKRIPASRTTIREIRLAAGEPVELVNISRTGVLLESGSRMRPGMRVTLHFKETEQDVQVRGRVIRCSIVGVTEGALRYRFAVVFDKTLDFKVLPDVAPPRRVEEENESTPPPNLAQRAPSPPPERIALNAW